MWNLQYDTMNISTEHKEKTCGCQGGCGGGREKLRVWGEQIQTVTYRIDKQQGPLYSPGNYVQYLMINHNGKEYPYV